MTNSRNSSRFARFLVTVIVCAALSTVSSCYAPDSLVPENIFEKVNNDGREWTYDTAWQNIRMLNAELEKRAFENIPNSALLIASQMERLEKGKAGPLTSRKYLELIDETIEIARGNDQSGNHRKLTTLGMKLQNEFDQGNFESAKVLALEIYAVSTLLAVPNK